MGNFTQITLLLIGEIFSLSLIAFGFLSIAEKEKRAAQISFWGAFFGAVLFILAATLPNATRVAFLLILAILSVGFIILFLLPIGITQIENDIPSKRFDEREIMFARARLKPGTPNMRVITNFIPNIKRMMIEHAQNLACSRRTQNLPPHSFRRVKCKFCANHRPSRCSGRGSSQIAD